MGALNRRGKLHQVHVSGFHLSLSQEVEHPTDPLCEKAKDPDFRLNDNGLHPTWCGPKVRTNRDPLNSKEASTPMDKVFGPWLE